MIVLERSFKLKPSNPNAAQLVYERASFICKAGAERVSQSTGIRASSTGRANCPFYLRIGLNRNKIEIKDLKALHENHRCDEKTFSHYPENTRLTPEERKMATDMIECGASKQKLKKHIMQRSIEFEKFAQFVNSKNQIDMNDTNELKSLLMEMEKVPDAKIEISKDDEDNLIGIFFQDSRMAGLFDKYPELLIFDATYRLNNRRMPLFVMLVVDGNGESEIACLWVIRSELRAAASTMLDAFKKFSPKWEKIDVGMKV